MMSKLLLSVVLLVVALVFGGFVVLAAWDVPVSQTQTEKTLDNEQFLQKPPQ